LDVEDAMEAGVGFATHVRAVKRSVQGLRALFSRVREARVEMARMERGLGYAILGMITSGISDPNTVEEEDEEDDSGGHKTNKKPDCSKGIVNSSGAWCWREDCKGRPSSSILYPLA
jgi:sorting nexin-9/18/33